MERVMQYSPVIILAVITVILVIMYIFLRDDSNEFVGLDPLKPDTCTAYPGSIYSWGRKNEDNEENLEEEEEDVFERDDTVNMNICVDNTPFVEHKFESVNPNNNIDELSTNILNITDEILSTALICTPKKGRFMSKGEKICKETMNRIYGLDFVSIRPNWLKNPETKCNLELDCYNDELKLAVEYNGVQHYKWPNFLNQSYDQFINQVRRDKFKKECCEKMGVYLIIVPYNVDHDKIPEYIMSKLPETSVNRTNNN